MTPFWSRIAWHADIVLPASAYLEQESILFQQNGLKPGFGVRLRCVDPRLDSRSDWRLITALSRHLGIRPWLLTAFRKSGATSLRKPAFRWQILSKPAGWSFPQSRCMKS